VRDRPCHLASADPADVPALVAIFDDAFRTDRHTQAKAAGRGAGHESAAMGRAVSSWLRDPGRCSVLKAVDDTTGEIVGWACWSRHGYPDQAPPVPPEAPPVPTQAPPVPANDHHGGPGLAALESVTGGDMARWQAILMPPGTTCRILNAVAVSPGHQGRGVGSALIRWGTEGADADGAFCWVHASEAGFPAFARQGFAEVGRLEVDLDDFAPVPPDGEGGTGRWGSYTFRYLTRLPEPSPAL
jgi:predicted N-acetyltransferase YhbS